MEEKDLNPQESLEVITRMINNTQEKWQRNAGRPSLIWGYTSVIVTLLIWTLYSVCGITEKWIMFFWCLIPIIGTILMCTIAKDKKGFTTFIDKTIKYIWIVLGCAFAMTGIVAAFFPIPVLFIIVLLVGIGCTLTGLVSKIKIYTWMGAIGALLSILCLVVKGIDACLVFAALFVVAQIIPGHTLNSISNKK